VRHVQDCPGQWTNPKKTMVYGTPMPGVDDNLTYVHSKVDSYNNPMSESTYSPMPESTLSPSQVGFGLGISLTVRHAHCPRLSWSEYL
jgi:hypothetical protein